MIRSLIISILYFLALLQATSGLQGLGNTLAAIYTTLSLTSAVPVKSAADPFPVSLKAASDYNQFSASYDTLDGGEAANLLGINDLRRRSASFAVGDVAELAVGTGLQSSYYDWSHISSFTGVDVSSGMLKEARTRISNILQQQRQSSLKVDLLNADAKATNLPSAKYDTVVDTFSMCVFDEPAAVMDEMKRLIKPISGRIILLENSRSTSPLLGRLQDISEPVITPMSKGCRWNVDVPAIAASAGLDLEYSESIQQGTIYLGVYSNKQPPPRQ